MVSRAGTMAALVFLTACALEHPAVEPPDVVTAPTDLGAMFDRPDLAPSCGVPDSPCCVGDGAPACNPGATCSGDGICLARCPAGETTCGGRCVATDTDNQHCGGCGRSCVLPNASSVCLGGVCSLTSCSSGHADCDGSAANGCEVDLRADPSHCGGCGSACSFSRAGATCAEGVCTMGACEAGFANCDGDPANGCEVGVQTNTRHCGACNNVCNFPGASAACVGGTCRRTSCTPPRGDCDGNPTNGCETDLDGAVAHCGACGNACVFANAGARCVAGSCQLGACTVGWADCDGRASTGCEVNLQSSPTNCGRCGNACGFARATALCTSGRCVLGACAGGWDNCNGNPADGCETMLGTPGACARCGNVCRFTNAAAGCAMGRCVMGACGSGFGDCDRSAATGCEVALDRDVAHCGRCGTVCRFANAGATCVGGRCVMGACDPGFGDCDRDPSNGCEQRVNTTTHCGGCGRACGGANATPDCASGTCRLTCNAGFGDCDRDGGNGCETNTRTSAANCRGCGMACPGARNAVPACMDAACRINCNTGFANCDGNVMNGCEADLRSSVMTCGACDTTCAPRANATLGCSNGSCTFACAAGFGDCDRDPDNGCETNTRTSLMHCRGCGMRCPNRPNATVACVDASCVAVCNPGRGDCDRNESNGCETEFATSGAHCGRCGNACASGLCAAGVCAPEPPRDAGVIDVGGGGGTG